jgi:xanthine/CO dehydrogenase XdhC/CoxF family maturation factor
MKQFTYAGVSRLNGELKLRFTTSDARFLHLVKVGHTEVEMIKLTRPLTKDAAIKELLVRNFDNGRTEITNLLVGRAREATVKKTTVVVRVPPKAIQQLVGARIEISEAMTAAEARKVRDAWNKAHAHLSYDGK